jgi:hypothetical protein
MPTRRDNRPAQPDEERERERFRDWVRAGHRPAHGAPDQRVREGEPPFPKPSLEEVLAMPINTDERLSAKQAAAAEWLRQFCARARFVLGISDLRHAAVTKPDCRKQIDLIRPWVSAAQIETILERP